MSASDFFNFSLEVGDLVAHISRDYGMGEVTEVNPNDNNMIKVLFENFDIWVSGLSVSRIGSKKSDNMSQRSTREHNKPKE